MDRTQRVHVQSGYALSQLPQCTPHQDLLQQLVRCCRSTSKMSAGSGRRVWTACMQLMRAAAQLQPHQPGSLHQAPLQSALQHHTHPGPHHHCPNTSRGFAATAGTRKRFYKEAHVVPAQVGASRCRDTHHTTHASSTLWGILRHVSELHGTLHALPGHKD